MYISWIVIIIAVVVIVAVVKNQQKDNNKEEVEELKTQIKQLTARLNHSEEARKNLRKKILKS